jgi:hypothetical protein
MLINCIAFGQDNAAAMAKEKVMTFVQARSNLSEIVDRVAGLPLITGDGKIHESSLVRTVWD